MVLTLNAVQFAVLQWVAVLAECVAALSLEEAVARFDWAAVIEALSLDHD